jgi:hypothetical protein
LPGAMDADLFGLAVALLRSASPQAVSDTETVRAATAQLAHVLFMVNTHWANTPVGTLPVVAGIVREMLFRLAECYDGGGYGVGSRSGPRLRDDLCGYRPPKQVVCVLERFTDRRSVRAGQDSRRRA